MSKRSAGTGHCVTDDILAAPLPARLRAQVRLGDKVCGEACRDLAFQVANVLTLLSMDDLDPSCSRPFLERATDGLIRAANESANQLEQNQIMSIGLGTHSRDASLTAIAVAGRDRSYRLFRESPGSSVGLGR